MPPTSATYTGLGASCTVHAPATAHSSQATACHGRTVAAAERIPLACTVDSGRAQPRMVRAVPLPDRSGGGAGEAGARPALTRNCERSPSGGREPGPPPRSTGLPVPAERVALGGRVPGPRGTGPAEEAHMRGVRSPRWALLALAVGLVAGAFGTGVVPEVAPAASPHQAAVIVDTGSTVKRVVITFDEDSITGLDALQRAGTNPVVYQFGGQGGAVCRLLGVGRDAGPDCLGGGDGDARYWAYFRAPAGT